MTENINLDIDLKIPAALFISETSATSATSDQYMQPAKRPQYSVRYLRCERLPESYCNVSEGCGLASTLTEALSTRRSTRGRKTWAIIQNLVIVRNEKVREKI